LLQAYLKFQNLNLSQKTLNVLGLSQTKGNMGKRKRKNKPEEFDDEDDDEILIPHKSSYIQVGDIVISTNRGNLKTCKNMAEQLIKSRSIKRYLGIYARKKMIPMSIG
jgi:hypothetical protein